MHSTGDYTAAAADRATSPNCSSQPWKLFLRNAAADNTLSYFAIASASGASERRHAVRELLLAVPDEVAWCWAKAEYWRRRMTTLYATEAVKVSFPLWVSDPAINWLAELEEIVATDGSTGEVSCVPSKLGGITRVSNELKDDASPDIAAEIGAALANQIAFGIDNAFLGDGSTGANAAKVPDGLLSLSAGYQSVDTVSGVVNTDPFIAAIFKAQNVGARIDRWIMSPTTAETLSKLKKQSGRHPVARPAWVTSAPPRRFDRQQMVNWRCRSRVWQRPRPDR